jgi:hypothetical protein
MSKSKRVTTYEKNGKKQFTCSEKIKYHKQKANDNSLPMSERVRHGVLAKQNTDKLQKFMAYSESDRKRIVAGQRPKGKPSI